MGVVAGLIAAAIGVGAISAEESRKSASKSASKQIAAIEGQGAQEVKEPLTPPDVSVGTGARDELRRRAKAKVSGRRKTIVTGDLTPPSAKKSVLG